jgi:hypothetical protein
MPSKPDTEPLLPHSPVAPPTGAAVGLVNALAWLRVVAGASCVVAPVFTGRLFQFAVAPASMHAVTLQLFGVRDFAVGELTWFVRPRGGPGAGAEDAGVRPRTEGERQELRRVLWTNLAVDSLDIAVLAFAYSRGAIAGPAFLCVGGGAAAFAALGGLALRQI